MSRALTLVGLLSIAALAGCIGEDGAQPDDLVDESIVATSMLAELPATITGLDLLGAGLEAVPTGSGIWTHGDFAYSGGRSAGFFISDISDPTNPVLVGSLNGTSEADGVYARDVDLIHYDDGRTVAVLAGQNSGMYFVDVTDVTAPKLLTVIEIADLGGLPTHNVAVIPGTTYVFNAPSGGNPIDTTNPPNRIARPNALVDAADPANPVIVAEVGEHGCHDIAFYMNDDEAKYRAYCAGRDNTEIWDIAEPLDTKIITQFNHPVLDNGGGLHHLAMVNQDATLLVLGDEFRGGGGPGCHFNTGDASSPTGALWFFDITGDKELAPEELGSFSPEMPLDNTMSKNEDYPDQVVGAVSNGNAPGAPNTSCTSHFGSFVGDTDVLAMSWYHAGVILIDTSDATNPTQIDQFNTGTNTWDVKYHRGVLITGDMDRGLDILKLV